MTTPSPPRRSGAALAIVYATVFLDLLGFGIILPALPYYADQLGAGGFALGLLFASYSLAQILGAAVLGRVSDSRGRRPILLLSLCGSVLSMVLSGLATSLAVLMVARALAGLFGGSISTAKAYIADITAPEERARYMGLLGASIGSGFVLGPGLGAGLIALGYGFKGAAFVAAGLAAVNLAFALFKLPEPAVRRDTAGGFNPGAWLSTLRRPNLGPTLAATFLTTFAFVGMETTFAYLGKARFNLDELHFGLVLLYAGVIGIIVQGSLIGRLTHRFGVRPIAATGGVLMGLALLLVPACTSLPAALGAMALLAVGQGFNTPSLSTMVSNYTPAEEQGSTLGVSQSLAAAARAVGPLVAGALYDLGIAFPYLLGGILALIAGVLVARIRE